MNRFCARWLLAQMVGLFVVSVHGHVRLAQTVVELSPPTAQPLGYLTIITHFPARPSATAPYQLCPHDEDDCVSTFATGQRLTGTTSE
jgi:hypothetical protein